MRLDGKKKREACLLSRIAAVYGLPSGRPADYGEAVGLLLNEHAALRIKALSAMAASGAEDGLLDGAWAEAFSPIEEEGGETLSRINDLRASSLAARNREA